MALFLVRSIGNCARNSVLKNLKNDIYTSSYGYQKCQPQTYLGHEYTMSLKLLFLTETRYYYCQKNGEDSNNYRCGNTWEYQNLK